jgi:ABC-type molybdenum transport system ATPase subunit/photorepair protein PhrA
VEYQQWLESLKPGDPVIIAPSVRAQGPGSLGVVSHRTSSGQIVVNSGSTQIRFNSNGWERVTSGERERLTQPTPEAVARIEQNELLAELREADWQKLSVGQLRRILTIVREAQR